MTWAVLALVAAVLLWPGRSSGSAGAVAQPEAGPGRSARSPRSPEPSVPDLLDLLALALRGGADVSEALLLVGSSGTGARGAELRSVGAALRWGLMPDAAWATAGAHWAPAATALRLASVAGVPPAGQLERVARELRRRHRARLAEETGRVGVRLVLPLGLTFLPAFVLACVLPIVLALAGTVLAD